MILYRLKRPFHFVKTGLLKGLRTQLRLQFPERKIEVIVVSGTDGKTTTATLLHHFLTQGGIKAGLITTVSAKIGKTEVDTGLHVTAPEPDQLLSLLDQMSKKSCTHVVLEMTSHGAYQFRNWGIRPKLGGITNITHEHFDYHQNYQEYARAKLSQFARAEKVFFPEGDRSYSIARKVLRNVQTKFYTEQTSISPQVDRAIRARFPEIYNQRNAILACLLALEVGVEKKQLAQATASFTGVPGRLEKVLNNKGVTIFVDFAHTPNAVAEVLSQLRKQTKRRLIVIHGAAGLRDVTKRPKMGRNAAEHADLVVYTAEDPRTENVWSIIEQMKSDLDTLHRKVLSIADRGEAIHFVLTQLAQKGDTIAILGKGHEQSMCFGTTEYRWNDTTAVQTVLNTGEVPQLGSVVE